MLREIRLYGVLARKFGRVHRLAVNSAQEAVRALVAVCPGFEAHLREHSEPGYHVWVGKRNLGEKELGDPAGQDDIIRIAPKLAGAKKHGLLQTIIGAVLIAVDVLFLHTGWLTKIGALLVLGGVAQMLTPTPKTPGQTENKQSYVFSGASNTSAQGAAIPIVYGEMVVGSAVISAGLSTQPIPA